MRTIIHVGQHKTGTTSIQHYLRDHAPALEQQGLYVPNGLIGVSNPSHFVLNVYSLAPGRSSPMKDKALGGASVRFPEGAAQALRSDIDAHYRQAIMRGCNSVIWSNEGLYLLNSEEEYRTLTDLFRNHSDLIQAVCCFRDTASYRESYRKHLAIEGLEYSADQDSYRYVEPDSWLFDYERKKHLLALSFDETTFLDYDSHDMVGAFLSGIGYEGQSTGEFRLNETVRTSAI